MSQTATLDAVALTEISASDDNVRTHMDKAKLKELAKSIASEGILMPLRLQRLAGGGYKVIAGHRRLAAVDIANTELGATITSVPAIIDEDAGDQDRVVQMLVENLQREDIDPIDEAEGYQRLIGFDMSGKDIATRTGRSAGHVSKRIKLLTLPKKALDLVRKGDLTIETALELADANAPDLVLEAFKVNAGNPTWALRQLVRRQEAEAKVLKAIELAEAAGIPVMASRKDGHDFKPETKAKGWVVIAEWGGAGGLKSLALDPKAHRKEECRGLLVIDPRYAEDPRQVVECCTDPSRHLAKGESKVKVPAGAHNAGLGGMTETEKAQRTATIARNKARREATKARDDVLTERAPKGKLPKEMVEFVIAAFVQEILGSGNARESHAQKQVVAWLELTPGNGYYGVKDVLVKYASQSPPHMLRLASLLLAAIEHEALANGSTYELKKADASGLTTMLLSWGYELSAQEKIDLGLAKAKKVRTPKPTAEAHPDPEVDAIAEEEPDDVELEDDEQSEANVA